MSSWHRNEYILKGVFLGLWVFVALQVAVDPSAVRVDLPWVLGWMSGGLVLGLVGGTVLQMIRGVRPWHNWVAFPLLVLLESPTFVYGGICFGLAAGVLTGREFAEPWAAPVAQLFGLTFADIRHVVSRDGTAPGDWLGWCVGGGALLGFGFYRLRQVTDLWWRFVMGLTLGAALVYLGGEYAGRVPGLSGADGAAARFHLGVYILLGLPFFYLLTFCAEAEESEVEIMALCAALGVALYLMNLSSTLMNFGPAVNFLLPITIYFVYATKVLPGLRVFKHVLRGYSYQNLGRLGLAMHFFRRATQLDPKSPFAVQGLRGLHENLTLAKLDREPELVEILDFGLCLDRAERFLLGARAPTPAERTEADRFLDLVSRKKPAYQARVDYLRAVSLTHAKDFDAAAGVLTRLLDPEAPDYHPAVRKAVLYPAWTLALRWSKSVAERVGWHELDKPGRRIEAIAAAERHTAANPADADAAEFKAILYSQLQEAEFVAAAANGPPAEFNYEYVEQLGLALIDDADAGQRDRGAAYLRIAGRGLRTRAPGIFRKLADAATAAGDAESARGYLEQVKRAALEVKPARLAAPQRDIYLSTLRALTDLDDARDDYEAAIGNLGLYLEAGGRGELEVFRRRADLYGKAGDAMNALLQVETGLTYNGSDPDLLKKKDSYYFSVTEEKLRSVREKVAGFFDVAYCVKKASAVLNAKTDDPEMLDWAVHLATLAAVVQPQANGVRLVRARCLMRKGDRDAGVSILEDIRESKKGSGDDEDAWYAATKILGELYLDEFQKPELAIAAFNDYKAYLKAGADTHYQLGRAYEALGDVANAAREYKTVTAFEGHPRYWDAKDALRRLGKE